MASKDFFTLDDLDKNQRLAIYRSEDWFRPDYRVSIISLESYIDQDHGLMFKEAGTPATFVTTFEGLKNFARTLGELARGQTKLTSVETFLAAINGEQSRIDLYSGKGGVLIIDIKGLSSNAKFFISRYEAMRLRTQIGNAYP